MEPRRENTKEELQGSGGRGRNANATRPRPRPLPRSSSDAFPFSFFFVLFASRFVEARIVREAHGDGVASIDQNFNSRVGLNNVFQIGGFPFFEQETLLFPMVEGTYGNE